MKNAITEKFSDEPWFKPIDHVGLKSGVVLWKEPSFVYSFQMFLHNYSKFTRVLILPTYKEVAESDKI